MQNPTSFLWSFAATWEAYGEFVQLMLALLFGWLIMNWLSTTAARVDGLSMTVRDLRKDLEEIRGEIKATHSAPRGPEDS